MPKIILALGLFVAACGSTDLERGVSGAAIGAAGAYAVGGSPIAGAVAGGAAGALCDDAGLRGCQ